jgi:hypothetical protein
MYYWSALLAFTGVAVGLLPLPLVGAVFAAGVGLALLVAVTTRVSRGLRDRRADAGGNFVFSFTKSGRRPRETASDQRKRS